MDEKRLILTPAEAQAAASPEALQLAQLNVMASIGVSLMNLLGPYKQVIETSPMQTLTRVLGELNGQKLALGEVSRLIHEHRLGDEGVTETLKRALEERATAFKTIDDLSGEGCEDPLSVVDDYAPEGCSCGCDGSWDDDTEPHAMPEDHNEKT